MLGLEDILPGCKLEIVEIPKENANGVNVQAKSYPSALYSVLDSHTFEVTVPTVRMTLVPLPRGGEYFFVFTTQGGLVRAKGLVENMYRRGNFYVMKIQVQGELSKYQRREFYRIDCMFPVMYVSLTYEQGQMESMSDLEDVLSMEPRQEHFYGLGTAIDISGGGMRFTSSINMDKIPAVLLKFTLDIPNAEGKFAINCRIVSSEHIEGTDKYSHRVQFRHMSDTDQEAIIRYIFETERRRRHKA